LPQSQVVVGKLSASDYPRAYICEECIAVCNSILEGDKPGPPVDSPRKIDAPFEVQQLLDQYLTAVVTQQVSISYSPGFRRKHEPGAIILAIRKPDGQIIFNPPADIEISENDYLIAMGAAPALLSLDVVKRPDSSLNGGC
jgi:hypothetical protein